jgi:hypothetical protein
MRQEKSGIRHHAEATDPFQSELIRTLDRRNDFTALVELRSALEPKEAVGSIASTAIAFDANVVLRLGGHRKRADIIDYLSLRHEAPIIVPGQIIQEFWNNHSKVSDSIAVSIRKNFDNLRKEIGKIDPSFETYANEITDILDRFLGDHGYKLDPNAVEKTLDLFTIFKEKATVAFAPRILFQEIALQRKNSRTPPGFMDSGDGDFYVWLDTLTALDRARREGKAFDRVVLISLDKKVDWSREGVAHPILVAELRSLFGCSFEIWTPDKLAEQILTDV